MTAIARFIVIMALVLGWTGLAQAQDAGSTRLSRSPGGTDYIKDVALGSTGYFQFTDASANSAEFTCKERCMVSFDTNIASASTGTGRIILRKVVYSATAAGSYALPSMPLDGTDTYALARGIYYINVSVSPGGVTALVRVEGVR